MQGTTYAVRIGTSLVNERRNANITHIDAQSVKHLTDSEIENALFYATIGDRDDDLVTLLRRDVIRRAINGNSERFTHDTVHEIACYAIFESLGSLFENADLHRDYITAYDSEGMGVEIKRSQIDVGNVD